MTTVPQEAAPVPVLILDRQEEGRGHPAPGHADDCFDNGCNDCELHAMDCCCPKCGAWVVEWQARFDAASPELWMESEIERGYALAKMQSSAEAQAWVWTERPDEMARALWMERFCREHPDLDSLEDMTYAQAKEYLNPTPDNDAFEELRRLVEPFDALGAPPAILSRDDDMVLLYAERVNWLFGKPGGGKSFLTLAAARSAIAQGGRVIHSDTEDRPSTVYDRSSDMGLEGTFMAFDNYVYFDHAFWQDDEVATKARQQALVWLKAAQDPRYSMLIIDSAESSGCPSDGSAVTEWIMKYVRSWNLYDVGVLVIDHLPKRLTQGDDVLGPIGSQHKLAAVTGVALEVFGIPWTRNRDGAVTLRVHKDRPGYMVPRGQPVATVFGEHVQTGNGSTLTLHFRPPSLEAAGGDTNVVDERLLKALAEAGTDGVTGVRAMRDLTGIRGRIADAAIKRIEAAGWVTRERVGRAHVFHVTPAGRQHLLGEEPVDDDE